MNSKIIIAKNIKMDRDYNNVLSYSEANILSLVQTNQVASANNYSFIRKNKNRISTHFTYSQCLQCNYMAFQNTDYSNKWFFAWIDEVIYKNDGATEIVYTVDEWSTWFDYWEKKPCFIVREHVNDDTVGLHTVPENIDIGDLICDRVYIANEIGAESYYWVVISCNYDPATGEKNVGVGAYAGYFQGTRFFAWLVNREDYSNTIDEINTWLRGVVSDGFESYITSIFTLPYQAFSFLNDFEEDSPLVKNGGGNLLDENKIFSKSVYRLFDDYSPKNNKLLIYPYSFCRVTNNSGSYIDYHIEDFNEYDLNDNLTDNMTFNFTGIPCEGYSGKVRPKDYRGVTYNEDESIILGKYPTLSWSTDSFTNWIAQQGWNMGVNNERKIINSSIGAFNVISDVISGIASFNPINSVNNISSKLNTIQSASFIPSNAQGNTNSGDINFALNNIRFKFMHMRPKKEYLQIIDDYFSRNGYKINRIKLPNITGRTSWNYVEIGGTEEIGYGEAPSSAMQVINGACRKGVTIWHNHSNIGNYNLANNIVT